jgi:hypothetical protein
VGAGTGIVLAAPRLLDSLPDLELPAGYELGGLAIGEGTQEVLTVASPSNPTVTDGRQIHKDRDSQRNVVLVVAIESPSGVWLVGPNPTGSMAGPLPVDQATRMLQAGLDEPTALAARQRLNQLLSAVEINDDLPGVTNAGLFATHYLATSARERADWGEQVAAAQPLLALRSSELIKGLGYQSEGLGAGALLLSTTEGSAHAVAVLMTDREGFDAATASLGASPVQYGLAKAHQERVPWLIVLRGAQIRLYPVRPDLGVGRRGQTETYLELDLSVVDDRSEGFLPLVFAAGSLEEEGAVWELLEGSIRYATELGERLRDRVYEYVVPSLAVAVANELERLGQGDDLDVAYRITLKILFRLLFQAYAEDQELLPYKRNDRYTRNSLTTQANDFVERPDRELDAGSHAIWDDLLQVWSVIDTGNSDWDVPAYNGGLFGTDPVFHPDGHVIDSMHLDDVAVGTALRHLLTDTTGEGDLGAVDFRSLSVREFGTIYEGLLESSLSRAETDLALGKNDAYVPTEDPDEAVVRAGEIYFHNASGERKATGSYFTKSFAVEHLLERALDPTLEEHLEKVRELLDDDKPAGAAEKFFDFRVADLAMGSGHFLIAAIDRMEVQMAAFLADHPIPAINQELDRLKIASREALGANADGYEIEPGALLRRQIARRCIYGIDINEVAVELARVAVWIHTFVPGLPMSSLDHTLVCANSLTGIGTIDEAVAALEPKRKKGMQSLLIVEIERALDEARRLLVDAANSSEATKAEVREAAEAARSAADAAAPTRLLFDAAVAVRIGELAEVAGSAAEIQHLASAKHVQDRLISLNPAHMPFRFPEVFLREPAGFDVLVGNPPWEKLKVERHTFWAHQFPGLKGLKTAQRNAEMTRLETARPDLLALLNELVRENEDARAIILSGPYPGMGTGDVDLFKAFAWRYTQALRTGGRAGLVLPRTAFAGAGMAEWRRTVLSEGSFEDTCFLTNTGQWAFDGLDGRYTLGLTVFARGATEDISFSGPFHSREEMRVGCVNPTIVAKTEFADWSDGSDFPQLPTPQSGDVLRKMKKVPRFDATDGFEFRPVRELDAANDKALFDTDLSRDDLEVPVLTGASVNLWDPDFGDPYGRSDFSTLTTHLVEKARRTNRHSTSAFFGLGVDHLETHPFSFPRIAFRDVARSTDVRTAIFCLVPPQVTLVHKAPYLLRRSGDESDEAFLLGVLSSIVFDWYARRWVELSMAFYLLAPMPVPRPVQNYPLRERVVDLSGRLAAKDERFSAWAAAVDVPVGSLTDSTDRSAAIAELDALSALLYGLDWDDVVHIFETFHRGWDYTERLAAVQVHFDRWESEA